MKVKELIEELQKYDPEMDVIMEKDAEGNGYSPLAEVFDGGYIATTIWYGERCLTALTLEDEEEGYTEEDVVEGAQHVVFLSPTN